MASNISTSLIISTYNRSDALELCVKSVLRQSLLPDEIIIADDGSKEDTRELIHQLAASSEVPIIHVWHEDLGFRLASIRNKAIAKASKEYIIQIDGDIVLHKDFVKDHVRFAKKGRFVTGSRVLIREGLTQKMLAERNCMISIHDKGTKNTINGVHLPWLSPLLQHYRQWDISYSRGCNMAFWKEDLLKVNGYNEAITGWGSEDHELVCRLINSGVRKRTIKFAGIVFHLHHELHGTNNLSNNRSILNETKVRKLTWCDKGSYKTNMEKNLNFLDRNEFNYSPSKEVVEALKNFDINKLCFYTRIYDEGKKSILSVFLSELYDIDETQVLLGYGGEDILKQAVHYFLTQEDGNKTMLIPKFSWWYYKSIADEVNGHTLQYPLYEDGNTFKYDFETLKDMIQKENPKILLLASPNNPTGNGLTPKELDELLAEVPSQTVVLIDEAYASFVSTDTSYIKKLVNKYPNLIISRTLSKFYGLPGLRMGFGFMSKELEKFSRYSNKYLGYNRISEDIAIAALKSDAHYRNIAKLMNEDRERYEKEIGVLPGFKVYESVANFILIKYPIELKEALQKAFAEQSYKVKFMNEPDINTHLRITLGRPEQNRIVIDTIKEIASK